ncbi:MAG: hypothetical protein BRD48_01075 [Bacteroidetes bacterium QS_9_68_14]|nr:MAG: hypothetical protein BRD48_01075 [Bacteroidetes bacterium QS_9_68_14]
MLEGSVAAAMVAGTAALAGWPLDASLLALAFCGTLLVYYLDRTPALSPEDWRDHPARWRWRHEHRRWAAALALGAAGGACTALPYLRPQTLAAGTVLAGPAAAYALPLFGGREGRPARRLKDIGAAKPFAVASAWAGASVLLPALESGPPLGAATPRLGLLVGYRMLFVLPNLLLADAAALAGDRRAALLRSPRRLRCLAAGALALALAGGGLAVALGGAPLLLVAELPAPALLLAGVATRPAGRPLARAADLAMLAPALPMAWRAAEGLL